MDTYVQIATKAIKKYVKTSKRLYISEVRDAIETSESMGLLEDKAGIFVSIHQNHQLRGCIGTIEATCDSIFDEIVYCAISACSSDPRFYPVREEELEGLEIKVDRLYPPKIIESTQELDVIKYGVIVEKGNQRGLLLPNLEGVDSVNVQVEIALQKAGLEDLVGVTMYRFEVERHQ